MDPYLGLDRGDPCKSADVTPNIDRKQSFSPHLNQSQPVIFKPVSRNQYLKSVTQFKFFIFFPFN